MDDFMNFIIDKVFPVLAVVATLGLIVTLGVGIVAAISTVLEAL